MNECHQIQTDHREQASGIPDLLRKSGIDIHVTTLEAGDYIIDDLW